MRLPVATVALALSAGAALGFACGSAAGPTRAPARPAPRGGDGVLARGGDGWVFGGAYGAGNAYGGAGYGGAGYGVPASYGGGEYGSAEDRGTTYGGYRFEGPKTRVERPYQPRYRNYEARGGGLKGVVAGRVRWPQPPAAPPRLAGACAQVDNPTLRIGRGGEVAGAVVYLVDISVGRPYFAGEVDAHRSQLAVGGSLERDDCGFKPYMQLAAPLGSSLVISSRGGVCTLRGFLHVSSAEAGPLFETVFVSRGGRADVDLTTPGVAEVRCEAGGLGAWVFVQPHPYHVLTDDAGRFRLGEVPPGRYRIAAWHPPVLVGFAADGSPRYSAAAVTESMVTVRADRESTIDLTLR